MAGWDLHDLCLLCRVCGKDLPCDVCSSWSDKDFAKIERQRREHGRKQETSTPRQAAKRPASDAEPELSAPKSPRVEATVDFEGLRKMLSATIAPLGALGRSFLAQELNAIPPASAPPTDTLATSTMATSVTPQAPQTSSSRPASAPLTVTTPSTSSEGGFIAPVSRDVPSSACQVPPRPYDSVPPTDRPGARAAPPAVEESYNPLASIGAPEPLPDEESEVLIMSDTFGDHKVDVTLDEENRAYVDCPSRLRLVSHFTKVPVVAEQPAELDEGYKPVTSGHKSFITAPGVERLRLPLIPQFGYAFSSLMKPLRSSANLSGLPKPPKASSLAVLPDSWNEPPMPTDKFFKMTKGDGYQTRLKESQVLLFHSTLIEWERAVRALAAGESYRALAISSISEITASLLFEEQSVASVRVAVHSLCDLIARITDSSIWSVSYLLTSITLLRRDLYLRDVTKTTRQSHSVMKSLRLSKILPGSLFGNTEADALADVASTAELGAHMRASEGSPAASFKRSRPRRARRAGKAPSQPTQSDRGRYAQRGRQRGGARRPQGPPPGRPGPEDAPVTTQTNAPRQPFRGRRRNRRGRGRGGQS